MAGKLIQHPASREAIGRAHLWQRAAEQLVLDMTRKVQRLRDCQDQDSLIGGEKLRPLVASHLS
ncbi:hypothetical protein ACQR10_07565 [Bradyrhizobium sp. HKCCYLRH2060]|uniref:hypothetical protein n=1 Tax=Bradyrhizobium TaxID=374 RepID=UPI00291670D4|nr:hypothetical protein [Bradyrhizobium sp. SZCCHNR3003]